MPKCVRSLRVWRVSSQRIRSADFSASIARGGKSPRLPSGVPTMRSLPVIRLRVYRAATVAPTARRLDRQRLAGASCIAAEPAAVQPSSRRRYDRSSRSEEHTSELQSRENLVCRLLLEKKKKK